MKNNHSDEKKHKEEKQYVNFNLGNDTFGIEVSNIQEILGAVEITHLPNTMQYMKGVIDLRDTIVPIIDLRLKFDQEKYDNKGDSVILITEIKNMLIGLAVDSVSDVITMELSEIQKTPHFSSEIESDAIIGIGKYDNKIIVILLPEKLFKSDELEVLKESIAE